MKFNTMLTFDKASGSSCLAVKNFSGFSGHHPDDDLRNKEIFDITGWP